MDPVHDGALPPREITSFVDTDDNRSRARGEQLRALALDRHERSGACASPKKLGGDGPKTMRILLIDNYDSFTWNLVHLIGGLGAEVDVRRNDTL